MLGWPLFTAAIWDTDTPSQLRMKLGMTSAIAETATAMGLPDDVVQKIASIAITERQQVMDALKELGVAKTGQRLKLAGIIMSSTAPPQLAEPSTIASAVGSAASASPEPPSTRKPAEAAVHGEPALFKAWYEVLPTACKVREAPSLSAEVIGHKKCREVFEVDAEQDGWVRPVATSSNWGGKAGWMLVDGGALGLGMLLKQVPASARLREPEESGVSQRTRSDETGAARLPQVSDAAVERWVDDIE